MTGSMGFCPRREKGIVNFNFRRNPRITFAAIGVMAAMLPLQAVSAAAGGGHAASAPQVLVKPGPQNPFMAPGGVGSVHNDSESSNSTPQPGPGTGPAGATLAFSGTVCPTILLERNGLVVAYCLENTNPFTPSLRLLDQKTLAVLASLSLPPTGPFGVYLYLDQADRAVIGTGAGHIIRVASSRDSAGTWHLGIVSDWDVSGAVTGHCGGAALCDYVVSVKPDWTGRIWFSTTDGVVGTLDPATGVARTMTLPAGEHVTKAISAAPAGVAVVSDHALYLLRAARHGAPYVVWRAEYARGTGVKLGQTTDGSGTAPTFFGPSGDRYVTIIDNAAPLEHVLVYRVGPSSENRLLCAVPVFTPGASATENTSIGAGNTVIASSTAGYNFLNPTAPVPLPGGLTRVDVQSGAGCKVVWANVLPSDAVPKLSVHNGDIYTFDRTIAGSVAQYSLDVIDSATGHVLSEQTIGAGPAYETLQLPPMLAADGTLFESTVAGIIRVAPVTAETRGASQIISGCAWNQAMVRARPSGRLTSGFQPSSCRARSIRGWRTMGSS